MAPPKSDEDPLPCPSWIFSTGTNVHVAKDRSWFADDYTPIESFIEGRLGDKLPVIGMGTVNLPTKVAAKKTGPTSHGTLRLEKVMHVPSALCNIIGAPIFEDYNYSIRSRAFTDPATGRQVAYCKPDSKRLEIRLSGPPIGPKVGPSPFDPSAMYMIGALWPESEQTRVAAEIKRKNGIASVSHGIFGEDEMDEQALSMLRNLVLDKLRNFEDEDEDEDDSSMEGDESDPDARTVNFMLSYGLKFDKDEDCEEAQAIGNALTMDDSDDSDADFTDSEHSFQEPVLETNYLFSPKQVDWLERKYGSTQKFMIAQKFNAVLGSDCDDARIRAKALMAEAGLLDEDSNDFWVDEDDILNDATDRLFSSLELRYVRCWFISSKNFMTIFGYDVTVEEDCQMAKATIQDQMKAEYETDNE